MSTRLFRGLLTAGLAILLTACSMGSMMIHEQRSPYDFETTLATVEKNAKAQGWLVAKSFDFQKSLLTHGRPDPGRLTVIKLCSPELATRLFANDETKYVSVMAPCSISVFEKSDGHTYLATMNMGLMARLMGDGVGPVLAEIAADDAAILRFAQAPPAVSVLAGR